MNTHKTTLLRRLLLTAAIGATSLVAASTPPAETMRDASFGRYAIHTIPFSAELRVRSSTFTPSGKVLVSYIPQGIDDDRHIHLAVLDDDGKNMRPFFAERIPVRDKDNGLRLMVFADNRRIFMGDFILECAPSIDSCEHSQLLPVEYPVEVAGGKNISHRWSEIIVAPDNRHIAWTTLLSNYSAVVFIGELLRRSSDYLITKPQIVSTLDPFSPDPKHPGGSVPNTLRNGEVKQFVNGGAGISMVGAHKRDTADSVVQDLRSGEIVPITDTPGYNETTIFSPDEQLGITMSTRFSPSTDMAILGLLPRPYPASLNMGLNMHIYTHSVTGVRRAREGTIGPVLIDIAASMTEQNYRGLNLSTGAEWVFYSPMSWHPDGTKAMWMEGRQAAGARLEADIRMRVVHLVDYEPRQRVAAQPTPTQIPYASTDLSAIERLAGKKSSVDITVHGRHSGQIDYRRTATGFIEKVYVDFSDDGKNIYRGSEKMVLNPRGHSTYTADVTLSGPKPGRMALKITFGPLQGELPSQLIFAADETGAALTRGYSEYDGERLNVDTLIP